MNPAAPADGAPLGCVADVLAAARRAGVARLDAQLLLTHHLRRTRAWLLAHDDAPIESPIAATLRDALARRAAGEPLAYVIGMQSFRGLALQVGTGVLVPRPETEVLVEWALERLAACHSGSDTSVVDLGTGSGAIALAVKQARPDTAVCATDRSAAALAMARRNALQLGLDVELVQGDWWGCLEGRRFTLALANPPYVAESDPHLSLLQHEPQDALTPGGDGLDALRAIVAAAPAHLLPGAWLLLEHGHDQPEAVRSLLVGRGFQQVETRVDLAGLARCTGGVWPGDTDSILRSSAELPRRAAL
ncbi:MAG: peptide chain release factor N(5)-glutamine methyltransferase [Burkholderiaceae bacterium]